MTNATSHRTQMVYIHWMYQIAHSNHFTAILNMQSTLYSRKKVIEKFRIHKTLLTKLITAIGKENIWFMRYKPRVLVDGFSSVLCDILWATACKCFWWHSMTPLNAKVGHRLRMTLTYSLKMRDTAVCVFCDRENHFWWCLSDCDGDKCQTPLHGHQLRTCLQHHQRTRYNNSTTCCTV